RDKTYKEMKLDQSKKTDSEIIKLMVKYPGLILRPIVILKNKALVGKLDPREIKN
ncbi:MAG: arsenate reductase family protein, partial [Nitrosopumilus sp.]